MTASECYGQSLTQYRYDALGRLISTEDGVSATSSYSYDSAGNRSRVSQAAQFPQSWAATSPAIGHLIGREEAGNWSAGVGDPADFMIYGPYTAVAPGQHVAAFRMLVDNNTANNAPVVDLDVRDSATGALLATRRVSRMEWKAAGAFQVFELPFELGADGGGHGLEFRVYYLRSSYVRIARVGYR